MDDNTIQDLKQFITVIVSQQISDVRIDIKNLDIKLSTKIDDLSSYIGDAIENTNVATDEQLKNHEKRITKLEHKPV